MSGTTQCRGPGCRFGTNERSGFCSQGCELFYLRARVAALEEENEKLRKALDGKTHLDLVEAVKPYKARAESAEAELERARGLLKDWNNFISDVRFVEYADMQGRDVLVGKTAAFLAPEKKA